MPSYKGQTWEDESYDVVEYLIDNDPIELGAQLRRCQRALATSLQQLRWALMELGPEGKDTSPEPLAAAWEWLLASESGLGEGA